MLSIERRLRLVVQETLMMLLMLVMMVMTQMVTLVMILLLLKLSQEHLLKLPKQLLSPKMMEIQTIILEMLLLILL